MNNKKCIGLNNGWLLCESKSFPGKLYYFNVRNGEAAWSFNDADTTLKKSNSFTDNIADKTHNYPEPTTLPDTSSIPFHKIGPNIKPELHSNIPTSRQRIFGQPAYPKFAPNVDTKITKIVWTPVQVPMPVCWNVESKKPMSDKVTQTSDIQEILVQTCEVPLSKRFVNNKKNNMINKATNFETSTPITVKNQNLTLKPNNLCTNYDAAHIFQPKSPDIGKYNGKSVFVFGDKVESAKADIQETVEKDNVLKNLDSNDLRFHLLAKRKKSADMTCEQPVEKNKSKVDAEVPVSKKVTFNLVEDVTDDTSSEVPPDDDNPPSKNQSTSTTDIDKSSTKLNSLWFKDIQSCKEPNFLENVQMFKNNKNWFLAVDTEVLLLDYEAIETIVKADPTCKLLIPHVVHADIEAICLGTCDGQQRVLNARQITRKLAIPPPYFLVEPPHNEDCFEMATESILNCCMKAIKSNYYVVLITNDPHLKNRASILNIPSFKLNEIKNGVNVKPDLTDVNVKYTRQNDDVDKKERDKSNLFNVASVKKQLFLDSDDFVGFDRLIDITKPKYLKDCDFGSDSESIGSDISRDVQNLNLKDKNLANSENVHRNPFLPENGRNKLIPTLFEATSLKKTIQNSKFDFKKPLSIWNFDSQKKEQESLFSSNTISNNKKATPNSIFDFENLNLKDKNRNPFLLRNDTLNKDQIANIFDINNVKKASNSKFDFDQLPNWSFDIQKTEQETLRSNFKTMESSGKQDTDSLSKIDKLFEINKIKVKNSSQQRAKKILEHVNFHNTTDNTGTFKIPQPLQFKNRTRNTGCLESPLNSKFGMWNLESVDENLKIFSGINKTVGDRIIRRIEEFLCIYIQVMEDVLNDLLRKNNACTKDMLPPVTLQETLNCIKMLYNEYDKIKEVIYSLILSIDKCISDKGNLMKSMKPDDFMKMFGYGVMLIIALQNILPSSEELKDAELSLSSLLTSIESGFEDTMEDPLKTPPVRRSDVDEKYEFRPNFLKQPSYVLEYLKKHFKEWTSYDEDIDNQNVNNNTDVKVLRTVGKNLNLLKIDKNKSMSLTQNATEGDTLTKNKNESEIFTFTAHNQITQKSNKDIEKSLNNKQNLKLTISNIPTKDAQIIQKPDLVPQNNILADTSQTAEPNVIRSMKIIDEYEEKIKQPLDLDLLDYSDIYEPSLEYDSVKENEGSIESKDDYIIDEKNRKVNQNQDVVEKFDNYSNNNHENDKIDNMMTMKNIDKSEKIDFEVESETFTEKFDESGVFNDVSDGNNDLSVTRNDNDSVLAKDDVTNDSGFENDSTCALMTVKIFFNELSTTFKAVSNFITNFSEEIQKRGFDEIMRNAYHQKAVKCLENLEAITLRLRSIIQREAAEVTVLKTLLLKAGLEATNDKRVMRYRQVVIKCLQQALILENAVKIIINTTAGDIDAISCSLESIHSRYFNIFDN